MKNNDNNNKPNSNFVNSFVKLFSSISNLIWAAVFLLIVAAIGKIFIFNENGTKPDKPIERKIEQPVDWSIIDGKIVIALTKAKTEARSFATEQINRWSNDIRHRIDTQFLDWYFGYWNQQMMGLKAAKDQAWYWISGEFDMIPDAPSAIELMTQNVQEKFASTVLRPQIAHRQMMNIADETVKIYISKLADELKEIPKEYNINKQEWENYLEDIAITTTDVDGNRSTDLSLKAISLSSAAAGTKIVISLKPAISNIGSKVSTKLAGKAAGKMAAKSGGKIAAKAGGKLLGSIVGIGIIVWDIYDHNKTVKEQKPVLKNNLYDYVDTIKDDLLHEPGSGIMSIITTDIEDQILSEIQNK